MVQEHEMHCAACADGCALTDADDKSSKMQLKTDRNAAMDALEKMEIS
jgi:hypothetical protein